MKEQLVFYGECNGVENLYVRKKIQDIDHAFEILKYLRLTNWRIYSAYYVNPQSLSTKIPLGQAIRYGLI